jgi:hypothetical protein
MQVTKSYARGGFFGNSQDKFSHMAGAEGGFDRKEFRDLRRRKRQGESLSGADAQRLNYMKNVRGDRTKKAIMGGALAAGAAIAGGPALMGALQNAGGLSGIAGKLGGKGLLKKAGKFAVSNLDKAAELKDMLTPEQEAQIESGDFYGDPSMRPFMMGGKYRVIKGEGGLKVPEGADVRSLLASLDQFQEERDNENRMIAPGRSNREILEMLLEKYKDSVPSIMGPKATDRYFNR